MAYSPTTLGIIGPNTINDANPTYWSYYSSTDDLATVKAALYFVEESPTDNQFNLVPSMKVSDLIWIVASDGTDLVKVTAVDPVVVSTTVEMVSLTSGNMFVGNATNDAVGVTMSGDVTNNNAGVQTLGAVVDGTKAANLAANNTAGGMPVLYHVATAGGATADTDVVVDHKVEVVDAWVLLKGLGTTSDTITIKNGSDAITNAIDIDAADNTRVGLTTRNDAFAQIAAAGTLRITETDGGGADSPACDVMVLCKRVA